MVTGVSEVVHGLDVEVTGPPFNCIPSLGTGRGGAVGGLLISSDMIDVSMETGAGEPNDGNAIGIALFAGVCLIGVPGGSGRGESVLAGGYASLVTWGCGSTVCNGLSAQTGVIFRINLRFLIVVLPEPSMRIRYCLCWPFSITVPVFSQCFGLGPV